MMDDLKPCPLRFEMMKVLVSAFANRGPFPNNTKKWAWHITTLANDLVTAAEDLKMGVLQNPEQKDTWGPIETEDFDNG